MKKYLRTILADIYVAGRPRQEEKQVALIYQLLDKNLFYLFVDK